MNDQDSQFDSLLPPLKLDRRGFIATSVAAGFSLAAGQAVAQTAIATTPPACWPAGWTFRWPTARCRLIAPRRRARRTCPRCWWCPRYSACTSTSRISAAAWRTWGIWRWRPSRAPGRPVALHRYSQAAGGNHQQGARRAGAARPGRRIGLGRRAWRRRGPTGHPGVLLGRTPGLALRRAQSQAARGAAWYGQLGGEPSELKPRPVLSAVGDLKAPVLGAYGGKDAGIALADVDRMRVALAQAGRRQGLAHRHLSRSAACLPCGLPAQLPQGRGRSGLAAHAGLVQAERAVGEGGGARASRFLPLQVRPEGRREPCLCPISRFPRQAVADLGQGRLHVLSR